MAVFSQTPSFLGFFYLLYLPPLTIRVVIHWVVVAPPTLNPKADPSMLNAWRPLPLAGPHLPITEMTITSSY
jgi:hypothetical protein